MKIQDGKNFKLLIELTEKKDNHENNNW
jgi:hypothetical protein